MEDTKKYYIRRINKLRRKTTSIMNKINNNQLVGENLYANHLYKFQQLDNTMLVLEEQLNDLLDIYQKTKYTLKMSKQSRIPPINQNQDNLRFKPLEKKELDILLPIFLYYYNNQNNTNTDNIDNTNFNDSLDQNINYLNYLNNTNNTITDIDEVD
tara:strand:- start:1730 stop:2197 length:468 start_codon:yes stop_codon:yes gene_type:complete